MSEAEDTTRGQDGLQEGGGDYGKSEVSQCRLAGANGEDGGSDGDAKAGEEGRDTGGHGGGDLTSDGDLYGAADSGSDIGLHRAAGVSPHLNGTGLGIFKQGRRGGQQMSNHEQNLMLGASAGQVQTKTLKRTLCVQVTGSPSNLSLAGPQAAMWKPASGKETQIFSQAGDSEGDPGDMVNSMRNGAIKRMSVEGYTNTFPFTLGVTMSCVEPNEVTDLGERFAYTVLPKSSSTTPQTVYTHEAGAQEDEVWQASYSQWNKSNLETQGVMDTTNQPYVFVHMSHPAIGILKYNAAMIGCDIEKQPKFDGQYYKITRQVMNTCCQALRTQVLGRIKRDDLNLFSLQLHRLNAPGWDHLDHATCMQGFKAKAKWTPEELAREKEHHLREFMTTEYQYTARLLIEYEVPTTAPTA